MAKIELPFAAVYGEAGFTQNSRETLVNMYAEPSQNGKSKLVRRQRPGLRRVLAMDRNKRGIAKFTHGHYFVARRNVYRFDGTATTLIGSIETSKGQCTLATDDNGKVAVCDGVSLYHWNGESAFTKVATPTPVGSVTVIDGFGVYHDPGTGQFYVSGLNDLTTWDALDFATAEQHPDPIVRVYADQGELWLYGEQTTEVWRNSGAQTFPFAPNVSIPRGCLAPFSLASDDNTTFCLGDDGLVYRFDGYRPARISTHEIEDLISKAPEREKAHAFIYTHRGHKFYTLTFPGYATVQYNIATGFWSRAKTWERDDWEVVGGSHATDFHLTPRAVIALDQSTNRDDDLVMERGGVCAPVASGGDRLRMSAFWLEAEVGRVREGDAAPQVMLRISRNGEDFGSWRVRSLGTTGNYAQRAVWRDIGQARQFVLEFAFTDDAAFKIVSTHADVGP